MPTKKHSAIGCCGIDCGLCPRYYTVGSSRCPGCGGEGFEDKHPSCGYLTCCAKKHGLEVCSQCSDYPCKRFEKETGERDSFVLHRKVLFNQKLIAEIGLSAFLEQQQLRINFLKTAIRIYDDGKSKNLFCIAATLLSIDSLNEAIKLAESGEPLKIILSRFSETEGQELKLRK